MTLIEVRSAAGNREYGFRLSAEATDDLIAQLMGLKLAPDRLPPNR